MKLNEMRNLVSWEVCELSYILVLSKRCNVVMFYGSCNKTAVKVGKMTFFLGAKRGLILFYFSFFIAVAVISDSFGRRCMYVCVTQTLGILLPCMCVLYYNAWWVSRAYAVGEWGSSVSCLLAVVFRKVFFIMQVS